VKPNTSIIFTQIPKRHIPDIHINNLEKTKMLNGNQRNNKRKKTRKDKHTRPMKLNRQIFLEYFIKIYRPQISFKH